MNEVKDLNAMSDQELSECFAFEVAGYVKWSSDEPGYLRIRRGDFFFAYEKPPSFATDANAVLPWLEKVIEPDARFYEGVWDVAVTYNEKGDWKSATAATFPRAACCALIAARRAAKEATP